MDFLLLSSCFHDLKFLHQICAGSITTLTIGSSNQDFVRKKFSNKTLGPKEKRLASSVMIRNRVLS